MDIATFERLLRPRSIAIIGASSTPGSLGECVLSNLEAGGFRGSLYLVNPKRPIIRGRQCLGSIQELPQDIDCAVLAIPGSAVLAAARDCAEKGVGSMIVFSAGFAEAGEDGLAAQRELAAIAKHHQIVLEGPNCLGMVNYLDRIPLTFVVTPPQGPAHVPGVAIISQSGALAAVIAVSMRHQMIPLTYSVSTGNEAATGIEDFVEYLLSDRSTRVMALVVEQFREPRRFLELARRARKNGQVIVLLHPGRSKAARASAATHTGAIAGDYEVMHTLVTRAAVVHVETMEELVDVSQILVRCSELPQGGAAIFTESGAFKALALDHCERVGLELPTLSPVSEQALREVLPPFIPPSNPLDLTAQGLVDPTLYTRTLPAVLAESRCGAVLLAIILTDPSTRDLKLAPILDAIRTLKPAKPVIFAAMDEGAPFESPQIEELRCLGIPCFPSPERAIRALARLINVHTPVHEEDNVIADFALPAIQEKGLVPEHKAKEILAHIGIRIPMGKLARTLEQARSIAAEIGFPVVLKVQSVSLSHKSDAGGVILGIKSDDALAMAWDALHRNVKRHRPDIMLEGALVEKMSEEAGIELIVGARNDPQWGTVVLVGFGGVLAEAMHDTRLLAPDSSREEIALELNKLRCAQLLNGFRGSPQADIRAVADAVFRIGRLMQSRANIEEIDINPLVVFASGKGALALDAVISFRDTHNEP
jgi:acyl-CoA synthetase (NDP forming)